ncbi:nuclease-related domain-containing protein [Alkalihalophilus pseudofirmus]|uniref:nuclease-related domain-containing protein n=1 Tax=Alkalihalophilus pseudofirmus TaxID=79885 RepID=UPI00259BD661|nr:nuclease-related domain-containing protein [Alkalihalophilus pseudofirmus]WEG16706.1 nuclease-related domain-containing protein [Alkalihalophilus pseudofirmus]
MFRFFSLLKRSKDPIQTKEKHSKKEAPASKPKRNNEQISKRKGELGEYKIDIQLDQLPKDCRFLSDLLVENPKAKSGYSQVDHVVITPYGMIVIETKNYQGTIYGGKGRKTWLVNGKFKMMNPFIQNYGHIQALKTTIDKKYHEHFVSMVSFTKRCTFKVDLEYRKIASHELIVYDIELSEFIHRKVSVLKLEHREPLLSESDIGTIYDAFSNANITDPKLRQHHEQSLKDQKIEKDLGKQSQCVTCKKVVSEKVKSFCLNNKKFEGKVYCYEHQKIFK